MKRLLTACIATLVTAHSMAFDMPSELVDLRNPNLRGEVVKIMTPTTVKVEFEKDGHDYHFFVEMINVDFGADGAVECSKSLNRHLRQRMVHYATNHIGVHERHSLNLNTACERMSHELLHKDISVEVSSWTQPILRGYIFKDERNYNLSLIERGLYRVDYTQSRSAHLSLIEGKARCQRVGLWKAKLGDIIEDMKCQESFPH
jgi:hypothetical protein